MKYLFIVCKSYKELDAFNDPKREALSASSALPGAVRIVRQLLKNILKVAQAKLLTL